MSVIEAITHGIPEMFRCVLDKLIIVVSGIGSIAFVIFLIVQKTTLPFLFCRILGGLLQQKKRLQIFRWKYLLTALI